MRHLKSKWFSIYFSIFLPFFHTLHQNMPGSKNCTVNLGATHPLMSIVSFGNISCAQHSLCYVSKLENQGLNPPKPRVII